MKAASSFTGREGAIGNLQAEIPHWDFDQTRRELTGIWEKHLASIQIKTDDETARRKFYGAMYRASFLPRTFNDADGRYPSFATGEPVRQLAEGETYYEDFSMWDTYRALHPLINLLRPTQGGQMMQSLVLKYEQGGWLPIFPCWNSYTAAMIGDHCIAALGDAYVKGVRNFDVQKAYEGMRRNAFESPATREEYVNGMGRRALQSYLRYGYIPLEDSVPDAFHTREQVSRTLEYAYDDFVLAQVAKQLGKTEDYDALMRRAQNYRNVIDPRTGYAQGRHADGTFLDEDNAFGFAAFITEGAPCHYTWYVPHDPYGLMKCMGGQERYIAKLDSMFSQRRYWHGNEPCHQVAFMYNYAGQPWKTQRAVRHILETEYLDAPGGLSGNDDAGLGDRIPRRSRRLVGQRRCRTDVGVVRLRRPRLLSRLPRYALLRLGKPLVPRSRADLGERKDLPPPCAGSLGGEHLHPARHPQWQTLYEELHRPRRHPSGRHDGVRNGSGAESRLGKQARRLPAEDLLKGGKSPARHPESPRRGVAARFPTPRRSPARGRRAFL